MILWNFGKPLPLGLFVGSPFLCAVLLRIGDSGIDGRKYTIIDWRDFFNFIRAGQKQIFLQAGQHVALNCIHKLTFESASTCMLVSDSLHRQSEEDAPQGPQRAYHPGSRHSSRAPRCHSSSRWTDHVHSIPAQGYVRGLVAGAAQVWLCRRGGLLAAEA